MARTVQGLTPRAIPKLEMRTRLAGLEPMVLAA
jgi:hypothetical protein